MQQAKQQTIIEEKIEIVTSEDHFSETFGNGQIDYDENRFIEFDGYLSRHTGNSLLLHSLRKGDKVRKTVYVVEGQTSLVTIIEKVNQ